MIPQILPRLEVLEQIPDSRSYPLSQDIQVLALVQLVQLSPQAKHFPKEFK